MNFQIKKNSMWAIVEIVLSSITLFSVYKLIVFKYGIATLGIWSFALSITGMARLVDPGTATGLSRFIAISNGTRDLKKMSNYYVIGALSTTLFYCFVVVVALFTEKFWIPSSLRGDSRELFASIVPFAVGSLFAMNLAGTTQAALTGIQRASWKSKIVVVSLFVQLFFSLFLIPRIGLFGFAVAQICQYLTIAALSHIAFCSYICGHFSVMLTFKWNWIEFISLSKYGIKLQINNLSQVMIDPAGKILISSLCGVEILGIYELSSKVANQLRQLLTAPVSNMVSVFAHYQFDHQNMRIIYDKVFSLVAYGAVVSIIVFSSTIPVISLIYFGSIDINFVKVSIVVLCGLYANVFAAPSYVLALGLGVLRWNMIGNAVTLLIICGLFVGVRGLDSTFVVIVVILASACGCAATWLANSFRFSVGLVPKFGLFRECMWELISRNAQYHSKWS